MKQWVVTWQWYHNTNSKSTSQFIYTNNNYCLRSMHTNRSNEATLLKHKSTSWCGERNDIIATTDLVIPTNCTTWCCCCTLGCCKFLWTCMKLPKKWNWMTCQTICGLGSWMATDTKNIGEICCHKPQSQKWVAKYHDHAQTMFHVSWFQKRRGFTKYEPNVSNVMRCSMVYNMDKRSSSTWP
jgi:hypothetical protein